MLKTLLSAPIEWQETIGLVQNGVNIYGHVIENHLVMEFSKVQLYRSAKHAIQLVQDGGKICTVFQHDTRLNSIKMIYVLVAIKQHIPITSSLDAFKTFLNCQRPAASH